MKQTITLLFAGLALSCAHERSTETMWRWDPAIGTGIVTLDCVNSDRTAVLTISVDCLRDWRMDLVHKMSAGPVEFPATDRADAVSLFVREYATPVKLRELDEGDPKTPEVVVCLPEYPRRVWRASSGSIIASLSVLTNAQHTVDTDDSHDQGAVGLYADVVTTNIVIRDTASGVLLGLPPMKFSKVKLRLGDPI